MSLAAELAKLDELVGAANGTFHSKAVEGDGTLILRGLAVGWGTDRQLESFDEPSTRAAFTKYLATNPAVCVMHNLKQVIGRLTGGKFTDKGIEVTAEIPKPPPGSELIGPYQLVKAGVYKAFSIGGRWKKLPGPDGAKLFPIELLETSLAGIPVHPETVFEVVSGKALDDIDAGLEKLATLTAGPGPLDDALERLSAL